MDAVITRNVIVVTNCTNRKRVSGTGLAFNEAVTGGPLTSVAARWAKAVRKARPSRLAQDVYMGRAFVEAQHVAASLGVRCTSYLQGSGWWMPQIRFRRTT